MQRVRSDHQAHYHAILLLCIPGQQPLAGIMSLRQIRSNSSEAARPGAFRSSLNYQNPYEAVVGSAAKDALRSSKDCGIAGHHEGRAEACAPAHGQPIGFAVIAAQWAEAVVAKQVAAFGLQK